MRRSSGIEALRIKYRGVAADIAWSIHAKVSSQVTILVPESYCHSPTKAPQVTQWIYIVLQPLRVLSCPYEVQGKLGDVTNVLPQSEME